ncbi:MAG: VCBS repeat-containing protein, partial [Candidatus Hydrogenedentota bacterium]
LPPDRPPTVAYADGAPSKLTEAVDAELADLLSRIPGASVKLGPSHYGTVSSAATMAAGFPEATLSVMGRVEGDEIEVSIVNTSSAAVVKSFRIPVPDDMKNLADEKMTPSVVATQPVAAPNVSGPSSFERIATHDSGEISAPLPYVPIDLTAGDIDGDGVDEIIIAENKTLHFYHIKANGALEEIGKSSTGWASLIFHLTACDLDGDGKAEIYVIEKPGNYVRSTAYRWTNGKLEKFHHESDVFLRAMKTLGQPALYGQRYGSNRPFERGILKYRINGGKLAGTSAGLPPQVTVYDFAPIGTTGFTASIDYENKLRLYNQSGDIVWTGTDFYGGSDVKIESADKRTTIEEKTGIATADLDGDGVEELLVVQNLFEGGSSPGFIRLANIQQYKTGRIVALTFSGGALSERWKSRTFNGIIKGFTIANPLSRGQEAVFFTQEKVNFTSKRATLRVIPLR